MTRFLLQTAPIIQSSSSSTFSTISCSFNPPKKPIATNPKTVPAIDRVIGFGRHKGKMLGTLPSSYLKWVSKNLRARDFEQWAKLADQVLQDPVYQDRIEWEFADNVLTGNSDGTKKRNIVIDESAVSQLLELSERFGWNNDDKVGWSKVNFELLGTSKGGRIPRKLDDRTEKEMLIVEEKDENAEAGGLLSEREERRRERRMRMKVKMEEKMGMRDDGRDKFGNRNDGGYEMRSGKTSEDLKVEVKDPFPGREALLRKVMSRKRFI